MLFGFIFKSYKPDVMIWSKVSNWDHLVQRKHLRFKTGCIQKWLHLDTYSERFQHCSSKRLNSCKMNASAYKMVLCLLYFGGGYFGSAIDPGHNEVEKSLVQEGDVSLIFISYFVPFIQLKIKVYFFFFLTFLTTFGNILNYCINFNWKLLSKYLGR